MGYKRISKDEYYLEIAKVVSKRSTCLRRHYGCVIVKDDIIIATGYCGNPRGEDNCCETGVCKRAGAERYHGYENCNSVHAEQNALIATERSKLIGSTVYLACEQVIEKNGEYTFEEDLNPVPCNICANMLKNAAVGRVVNKSGDIDLYGKEKK